MVSRRVRNSGSRSAESAGIAPSGGRSQEATPARAQAYTTGKSSRSPGASGSQVEEQLVGLVHHLRDPGIRPVHLFARTIGRWAAAPRSTNRVCGSGPSLASASGTRRPWWPAHLATEVGVAEVSMMLMVSSHRRSAGTAAVFLWIVMPFSAQIHRIQHRSPSSPRRPAAPAWRSIASTRVVLPWSTCATMATLRRSVRRAMPIIFPGRPAPDTAVCRTTGPAHPAAAIAGSANSCRWCSRRRCPARAGGRRWRSGRTPSGSPRSPGRPRPR